MLLQKVISDRLIQNQGQCLHELGLFETALDVKSDLYPVVVLLICSDRRSLIELQVDLTIVFFYNSWFFLSLGLEGRIELLES